MGVYRKVMAGRFGSFQSPPAFQEFAYRGAQANTPVEKEPLPNLVTPDPPADIGIPPHAGAKERFRMR